MNNQHPIGEVKDLRFEEPTFIDPLTRLFNQYYLHQFLPEEIKKAKLANYPLAIIMIDLDDFKNINDTYGHLCGDEVLRQLAVIMKKLIRQTDMVIRYAGDEFLILLPAVDLKTAEILSQRFVENIDKSAFKGKEGQILHLTISIGFALYPYDGEEIDELIDLADKALYLSKQKGKNRVSHAKEVTLEGVSYIVAMNSFPCPRFIDREEAIDRLKHIFDTIVLKSNLLQVTFIMGGIGTGKTRLLTELDNYVQSQNQAVVISSHSSTAHIQSPYYLFAKGISSYIETMGIDNPKIYSLISQIPPSELVQLSHIIPPIASLLKRPVDLKPEDKQARFLLFKGFLDLLVELSKTQAVLILFDDIQWIDKASIELIHYLSKQEKNRRIFIVSALIEDESSQIKDASGPKELLEDICSNDNFTQINLKNFSLEDTSEMIEAIFPRLEANKEFYELIYSITEGNPSFIEELLKLLIENAVIFYQDNCWQIKKDLSIEDIPHSAEEVIKKRLKKLDAETKEAIVQAAVIGQDFSLGLLNKILDKNEGFILELLSRAKRMRLVDKLEPKGKFSFINKMIHHMLYSELDDEQRIRLHYKTGQMLAEEHKDNLYDVAGELAFHFSKAPWQDKTEEYVRMLLEKIDQIFSPSEAIEYLGKLAKEVVAEPEGKKIAASLSDKMSKEAIRFIGLIQRAIKSFHLYPPGTMRTDAIKDIYHILNIIWSETETGRLNLAEVERGLVINSKRVSVRGIDQTNVEYFITLMVEHNLKTISFIKGVSGDDLDKFIQYISQSADYIIDKGGWAQIINKEGIKGIEIDEVRFIQVGGLTEGFEERKKIEDVTLMEFLLGKIGHSGIDREVFIHNLKSDPKRFAKTIMEVAQKTIEEGKADDEIKVITDTIEKINSQILGQKPGVSNYAKDLAKVILELKPALRNEIIQSKHLDRESTIQDIVKTISDEVIVDMIIEEYKESQGNLLVIKDSIDKSLSDATRKKEVLPKLESELLKLNVSQQDIDFIAGRIKWEDLPLDKRIHNLTRLPDKYYKLELEKIKTLLEELDSRQDTQELESVLFHFIAKLKQLSPPIRKDLMEIITDFIKIPFVNEKPNVLQMEDRLGGLLKKLNLEVDPNIFADILEIFKKIIKEVTAKLHSLKDIISEIEERPQAKGYCLFINQLLYILSNRFKSERDLNPQIYKLIENFIRDISYEDFLEILVYIIVSSPSQEKIDYPKDIFPIFGDKLIDTLINLETKTIISADPFQEYVIKREIVNLLQKLGEPALNILQQRLSQMKEALPPSLIELIGYLKKEEWIDLLIPSIHHKDPLIRRVVIAALGDIGGEKCIRIISSTLKEEKNKKIRTLAKERLARLKGKR